MDSVTHHHYKLFKPYGYLSQFYLPNPKKKKLLGELGDFPEGIMAIGRLDEPSEGLIFLTTDGKISEWVRSQKVEKEYYVLVDGDITEEALNQLQEGVEISIDGQPYQTKPCKAFKLDFVPQLPERGKRIRDDRHGPSVWISVTLREGKYRQVRKMTAVVGFPTLRLVRYRIGKETIEGMEKGEFKTLSLKEIKGE